MVYLWAIALFVFIFTVDKPVERTSVEKEFDKILDDYEVKKSTEVTRVDLEK